MFAWYWPADLCEREGIPFVLGHALAMKAIHGGRAKNDRLDAHTLAGLLKGGFFPLAYVYPRAKRDTRDLLRRRAFFVRQRAQLIAHIQNTNAQYNLAPFASDSGRRRGERHIRGGRREARRALYMAALAASRVPGPLRDFARRLKAKGKPPKVALIAVA